MTQFFILLYVVTSVEPYSDEYRHNNWRDYKIFRDATTTTPTPPPSLPTTTADRTRPSSTTKWTTTKKWVNLTLPRSIEKFYQQLGKWDGMQPAPGYEPYWKGYQWIFKHGKPKKSRNHTKTTPPTKPYTGMCGKRCPLRYKKYGEICARNRKNEFKSFQTLCFMYNSDCFGKVGWMLVYQGNCTVDKLPIFPTVTIHQHALELLSLLFTTTKMTTPNLSQESVSSIQITNSETDDPLGNVGGNFGGAARRSGDENHGEEDLS